MYTDDYLRQTEILISVYYACAVFVVAWLIQLALELYDSDGDNE